MLPASLRAGMTTESFMQHLLCWPGGTDLRQGAVERILLPPFRIVGVDVAQVANIANMIANTVLVNILHPQLLANQFLEARDCVDHRNAVVSPAAEVVDRGDARAVVERLEERTDIVRVDVVAYLLALVAVDPVGASLACCTGQVGQ